MATSQKIKPKVRNKAKGGKQPTTKKESHSIAGNRSTKAGDKSVPPRMATRAAMPARPRTGRPARQGKNQDGTARTLKERVRRAAEHGEPAPSLVESEAVGLVLSAPGLLDEVREEAFVALAAVVERKLAEHGHPLSHDEAANVAWRILGR